MRFDLTPEIIDQVIFAMENQESGFLVDTVSGSIVQDAVRSEEDPERYVPIPEWSSADGFHLMEKFVASLRNPLARERLRTALASGKGVFRSFKNALKDQEGVERLWFSFKDQEMKQKVVAWYNELCDAWGCTRLNPNPDDEETGELVLSDFIIGPADPGSIELIGRLDREAYLEAYAGHPDALVEEAYRAARRGRELSGPREAVLTTVTPAGELAGFIWASEDRLGGGEGGELRIFTILQLYVLPGYRGLGIAKALAERMCREAFDRGAHRLALALPSGAEALLPWLEQIGFATISRNLILDVGRWGEEDAEP